VKKGIISVILLVTLLVTTVLAGCTSSAPSTPATSAAPTTQVAAPQTYELKFQAHMAFEAITTGANLDKFIEMVEQNTNGRVKITRYPNDSIVGQQQILDGVSTGTLDVAVTTPSHFMGSIPILAVDDGLPLSWDSNYEMEEILWDYGLEDLVRQEYAKRGVYLLTDYSAAPSFLAIHMKEPVQSLEDLKGKKIRGFGSYLDIIGKLGASPVSMALGEVYTALSSGALDGVFLATSWSGPNKIYEVAPNICSLQ